MYVYAYICIYIYIYIHMCHYLSTMRGPTRSEFVGLSLLFNGSNAMIPIISLLLFVNVIIVITIITNY